MDGIGKRPATLVPAPERATLDKLSKATLMEILWDLADGVTGPGDSSEILATILRRNEFLNYARGGAR